MVNKPQGIVAVLVNGSGHEIATASDFETGSPAGYTQREIQEARAKMSLAFSAVEALSSTVLRNAINEHLAQQILRNMCHNECEIIIVPVGYDT